MAMLYHARKHSYFLTCSALGLFFSVIFSESAQADTHAHKAGRGGSKHPDHVTPVFHPPKKNVTAPRRNASLPRAVNAAANEEVQVTSTHAHSRGATVVVSRSMIDHFTAGSSPLQVLAATAPGVSFGSSDALGMDTAASTFYVRA